MGSWIGFGGYLVAEGGTDIGTETVLLQNEKMGWLLVGI
jgi:hypothetical protein